MPKSQKQLVQDVVADQLAWDSRVDASQIRVEARDGRVILRGKVPTFSAKRWALADALAVAGVESVDDEIQVEYPTTVTMPDDSQIQARVEMALAWSPSIDASRVRVSVDHGVVTLDGTVDAFWKKMHAEGVVFDVANISRIENHLTIVPTQDIVDEAIADDVIAAIQRSRFVDADLVDVSVTGGRATLTGTVPTRSARRAAYDAAAYTPGAKEVRNDLIVCGP